MGKRRGGARGRDGEEKVRGGARGRDREEKVKGGARGRDGEEKVRELWCGGARGRGGEARRQIRDYLSSATCKCAKDTFLGLCVWVCI